MDPSSVLSLRSEDVRRAAKVIARAFHDDPLAVHLYPDDLTRLRLAPVMFEAYVRYDDLFGAVDHLPGFAAVATWMAPCETAETPERLAQAGFRDLPERVPLDVLETVFDFIGGVTAEVAKEPHWHLRLLAVEPDRQGGGLGAIVLRHGLERAAVTGHPVLLETFAERAVPFYLRSGFELLLEDTEPASGVHFWVLRHRGGK